MAMHGARLIETITSSDPALRDRSIDELIAGASTAQTLEACAALEAFRQRAENLYERVRASMFLHAIYRYRLQDAPDVPSGGTIPFDGFLDLMGRRYEQAIASFRSAAARDGLNGSIASALASVYAWQIVRSGSEQ